ncbi:hypothetical protein [Kribbella sp. NPDC050459]|uniref:hypothetical protein n=1 Tax=Kribbella sp. NPDC050459 TaxID=3155785 RepID=UPI0033D29405
MSTMLDRLRRFRPVGTPGGAGPVGVPMDSRTGVPAELVPVFRALDAAIADSEEIRARASEQAARLIATARTDAAGMVMDARARATGEQAEVTAAIQARADSAVEQLLTTATAAAVQLQEAGSQRMDNLVEAVLDRLRADLWETT